MKRCYLCGKERPKKNMMIIKMMPEEIGDRWKKFARICTGCYMEFEYQPGGIKQAIFEVAKAHKQRPDYYSAEEYQRLKNKIAG